VFHRLHFPAKPAILADGGKLEIELEVEAMAVATLMADVLEYM
jgi:hypothetical protein